MAQTLAIDSIRLDGGTQPRQGITWEIVYDYGDLMEDGVKLPAVVVFYDGSSYWLADGFHRVHAAKTREIAEISAEVIQGTLEDAQWFSFGANKSHGLMRSNDDKQRAVQAALRHPKCAGLSNNQIAKHVGVDEKTVRAWRDKLQLTSELPKSTTRTGADGRTINTTNIGKTPKKQDPAPVEPPQEPRRVEEYEPTPATLTDQEAEPSDSHELEVFRFHLRSILETPLTTNLLVDEIKMSADSNQVIDLTRRVHEFLAEVISGTAASH